MAPQIKIPPGATLVDDSSGGTPDQGMKLPPGAQLVTGTPTTTTPPGFFKSIQNSFDENTQTNPTEPLLETGLKSVVRGIATPFVHPVETAKGLKKTFSPPTSVAGALAGPGLPLYRMVRDEAKGIHDDYKEGGAGYAATNAAGELFGGYVLGEGMGAARGALKSIPKVVSKGVRPLAENLTNTTPRTTARIVKDVSEKNAAEVARVKEVNERAAQDHLKATEDALHETRGREIKHQQDVKAAHDDAKAAQAALDKEHEAAVQKALDETRQKEDLHKADLQKAKLESEEAYQKKLADVTEQRAKAEQARRAELRQYREKRAKVVADRTAAEAKLKAEMAKQEKIAPTENKLTSAYRGLQAKIETARENALEVGNEQYNAVNEELNPLPADMEKVHSLYQTASNALGEAQSEPSILTRLGKAIKDGEALIYKDLQGIYSDLGKELSKGAIPGRAFHAYEILQDGVGEDMQRIADSKGMGQQLTDARGYWKRMKQTFGKPLSVRDAATKVLGKSASDLAAKEALDNQVRLLGSFDPDIPKQFNHVSNVEKGVGALPEPKSPGEIAAAVKAPAIPPRKPNLPPAPSIPDPAPVAPKEVAPPARSPLPAKPASVLPKLPEPPLRVAPPERPPEVQPKITTLTPDTLSRLKQENLTNAADDTRHSKSSLVSAVAGYAVIKAVLRRNLAVAGLDVTARMMYGAGKPLLADVLESPTVAKEMTKFTARDAKAIAKLPPEARTAFVNDMAPVVDGLQKKGIPVSPALIAVIGAQTGQQPKPKGVAAALTQP